MRVPTIDLAAAGYKYISLSLNPSSRGPAYAAAPSQGCAKVGDPMDDPDAMAALQLATGADGFNGDTMGLIPKSFYDAAMARDHPIALEPEGSAPVTAVGFDTLNWGEGWQYTIPPRVDTKKWLTAGKHQTNICDRWNQNKVGLATTALFNGIGMESWENVWGTWNGSEDPPPLPSS